MTERGRWHDEWMEVHRRESEKQIARLAMEKAYRRYQWWQEIDTSRDEWQEEQDGQT